MYRAWDLSHSYKLSLICKRRWGELLSTAPHTQTYSMTRKDLIAQ